MSSVAGENYYLIKIKAHSSGEEPLGYKDFPVKG